MRYQTHEPTTSLIRRLASLSLIALPHGEVLNVETFSRTSWQFLHSTWPRKLFTSKRDKTCLWKIKLKVSSRSHISSLKWEVSFPFLKNPGPTLPRHLVCIPFFHHGTTHSYDTKTKAKVWQSQWWSPWGLQPTLHRDEQETILGLTNTLESLHLLNISLPSHSISFSPNLLVGKRSPEVFPIPSRTDPLREGIKKARDKIDVDSFHF